MRGFTLIELMVTLSITMLVLLLSCGAASRLIQKNTAQAQATQLFHLLQFARTEAIVRNETVIVCASEDLVNCHNDWAVGAIVYIQQGAHKELLRSAKNLTHISHKSNSAAIKYIPNGHSLTRATIKVGALPWEYHIVVYDSGRVRLESIG